MPIPTRITISYKEDNDILYLENYFDDICKRLKQMLKITTTAAFTASISADPKISYT